ncbi:hypothetical protein AAT17_00080 [Nonlabens sp. MIC269]|uniref:tRNA (adenosine(37)-N6)-threonylcarbamoyltransferase complex ATPase subunit type 1 TsaE n=1 Tax=unclassified Nonlabens TaxID=2615035 RepID=UPI00072114DF|nr:tRNA (adenosine(37)-N6)-threonylcarbamoyltransferase complex ATPase subunit type 1 TsaE [Nonlabens sp. MIC269]ALM19766.1 hypothetical protein AAT17_00080 [Nonlabens sp. MIC269]
MEYAYTLDTVNQAAKKLLRDLNIEQSVFNRSIIICFEAEMGSGKTTLIKELCKVLKSKDEISSPTFSLVNEYKCPFGDIFHYDLYRINQTEELLDLGMEDYIDKIGVHFIEWPQVAKPLLTDFKTVTINFVDFNSRTFNIY